MPLFRRTRVPPPPPAVASVYVRAFTTAFFGFGKEQETAMRLAERARARRLPVRAPRRSPRPSLEPAA
jgi:hypothetical protein